MPSGHGPTGPAPAPVSMTPAPIPVLAHQAHLQGGHSSPNSESSGYMSNVSPQQMRVGSTSPNSNCDDVLDLSTDRRHSSSGASSRSSPTSYSTLAQQQGSAIQVTVNAVPSQHNLSTSSGSVSQRSTPSPIKEEPSFGGYHNGLPPSLANRPPNHSQVKKQHTSYFEN